MKSMEHRGASSVMNVRSAVCFVAAANFLYFFIEFAVAARISSVSLFADSIDFLEDTAVNVLILIGLGWSLRARALLGMLLAAILLLPGVATLWTAWHAWNAQVVPAAGALSITGAGALAVNLTCAFVLARLRERHDSLTRAAFLSARNDAYANVGIVGAGIATAFSTSHWPDFTVGLAIFLMNLDAAHDVLKAARRELRAAS